ncbi:MAG: hypothetical protein IIC00_16905 [Planctomycetes bacterium]|nr:hypothetical protein [Planctomycetota bacterium]
MLGSGGTVRCLGSPNLVQPRNYPLVCSSDAHRLEQTAVACTTFTGSSPSVAELGKALVGEDGREVMN